MNYQLFCPNEKCGVLSFHELYFGRQDHSPTIDRRCPGCRTQGISVSVHGGVVTNLKSTGNEQGVRYAR